MTTHPAVRSPAATIAVQAPVRSVAVTLTAVAVKPAARGVVCRRVTRWALLVVLIRIAAIITVGPVETAVFQMGPRARTIRIAVRVSVTGAHAGSPVVAVEVAPAAVRREVAV